MCLLSTFVRWDLFHHSLVFLRSDSFHYICYVHGKRDNGWVSKGMGDTRKRLDWGGWNVTTTFKEVTYKFLQGNIWFNGRWSCEWAKFKEDMEENYKNRP